MSSKIYSIFLNIRKTIQNALQIPSADYPLDMGYNLNIDDKRTKHNILGFLSTFVQLNTVNNKTKMLIKIGCEVI